MGGMKFVVVDGLDGSGKDTQARLIRRRYEEQGYAVVVRSHPTGDNKYGRKAKKALLDRGKKARLKASLYYALDVIHSIRNYHRQRTNWGRKKVEGNKEDVLIMVRYLVGVAYLPMPLARVLYKFFSTYLPTSRYMFFLDVKPEESLKRIAARDGSEREMFENEAALETVRRRALALTRNWVLVDGNGSIEETWRQIENHLDKLDLLDEEKNSR